ncbi:sugar phosphate isomerase/epimerase family protein [Peribacillus muralis]|uniref:sugar phosphate isomerase/epimerase family protein n=1 Tax=Peribacillus muralis TaxID=264697 RepID=UPI00380F1365
MKVFVCMNAIPTERLQALGHLEIIKIVAAAGADGVEIRKELLMPEDSLEELGALCRELNLVTYYSSPEFLFAPDHQLNEKGLKRLIGEAQDLGADLLKLPLGSYHVKETNMSYVNEVLTENRPNDGLAITIENDQTSGGGNLQAITHFLGRSEALDMPIEMTFDTGNWLYTAEEPLMAARELAGYVAYVHLKQVRRVNGGWMTEPVSMPLLPEVTELLQKFNRICPVAIEFPVTLENVATYISLMKMEQEVTHERA